MVTEQDSLLSQHSKEVLAKKRQDDLRARLEREKGKKKPAPPGPLAVPTPTDVPPPIERVGGPPPVPSRVPPPTLPLPTSPLAVPTPTAAPVPAPPPTAVVTKPVVEPAASVSPPPVPPTQLQVATALNSIIPYHAPDGSTPAYADDNEFATAVLGNFEAQLATQEGQDAFLNDVFSKGRNADTEFILDLLGWTSAQMDSFFTGAPPGEGSEIEGILRRIFPDRDLDSVLAWATDENPTVQETFWEEVRSRGVTTDTWALVHKAFPDLPTDQRVSFFAGNPQPSNEFLSAIGDKLSGALQFTDGWWKTGLMELGFAFENAGAPLRALLGREEDTVNTAERLMNKAFMEHGWKAIFSSDVNKAWDIYFMERDVRGPAKFVAEMANPLYFLPVGGSAAALAKPFLRVPVLGPTMQGIARGVQFAELAPFRTAAGITKAGFSGVERLGLEAEKLLAKAAPDSIRRVGGGAGATAGRFLLTELPTPQSLKAWMFADDAFKSIAKRVPLLGKMAPATQIGVLPLQLATEQELTQAVTQEVLMRRAILDIGAGQKAQSLAALRELGTTKQIYGVNDLAMADIRLVQPLNGIDSLALGDIVQAPERYAFTHPQGLLYAKRAQGLTEDMYQLAIQEGVDVKRVGLEPFQEFVHWVVTGRVDKEGIVQAKRIGSRSVGGIVPSMHHRRFESQLTGIEDGFRYGNNLETYVSSYVDDMFKAIADKRLADGMAEVVSRAEGLLPVDPLGRLQALYPGVEHTWTGVRKEMEDLRYTLANVQQARRGEVLSGSTMAALRRRSPAFARKLDAAYAIGESTFDKEIARFSTEMWTALKTTPKQFKDTIRQLRGEAVTPAAPPSVQPPIGKATKGALKPYQSAVFRATSPTGEARDPGLWGKGTYYTTDRGTAEYYNRLKGGSVISEQVTLNKPYIIDGLVSEGSLIDQAYEAASKQGLGVTESQEFASKRIRVQLESQGYDGVVFRNQMGQAGEEVVVFHPEAALSPKAAAEPVAAAVVRPTPLGNIRAGEIDSALRFINADARTSVRMLKQIYKNTHAQRGVLLKDLSADLTAQIDATSPRWFQARAARADKFAEVSRPRLGMHEGQIRTASGLPHPMFQNQIYPEAIADQASKLLNNEANGFLKASAQASGSVVLLQASIDVSADMIQGLIAHLAHPIQAFESTIRMVDAFIRPGSFDRYITARAPTMNDRIFYLGSTAPADFFESMGAVTRLAGKVPGGKWVVGQTYGRGQAAFSMWSTVYKDLMWDIGSNTWKKAGRGAEFARHLDRSVGQMSFAQLGTPANLSAFLRGWVSFAPQYRLAVASYMADAFKGGMTGAQVRRDLAKAVAGSVIMYKAWAEGTGNKAYLDPFRDGKKFMSIQIDDHWYGLGSAVISLIRMNADVAASALSIGENEPMDFLTLDKWQNPVIRSWLTQAAPLPGILLEAATQQDFLGYPLDTISDWAGWAADKAVPISAQDILFDKSGVPQTPLSVLANSFGWRTSPETRWENFDGALRKLHVWDSIDDLTEEQLTKLVDGNDSVLSVLNRFQKVKMFSALEKDHPEIAQKYADAVRDSLIRGGAAYRNYTASIENVKDEVRDSLTSAIDVGVATDGKDTLWLRDRYGDIMNVYGAKNDVLREAPAYQELFAGWDESKAKRLPDAEMFDQVYWNYIENVVAPDRTLPNGDFDFDAYNTALSLFEQEWGRDIHDKVRQVLESGKRDDGFPEWSIRLWQNRFTLGKAGYWDLPSKAIGKFTQNDLDDGTVPTELIPQVQALLAADLLDRKNGTNTRDAILAADPALLADAREELRKSNPELDAILGFWHYGGKVQSGAAVALMVKWGEELGIPWDAMGGGLPPLDLVPYQFEYDALTSNAGRLQYRALNPAYEEYLVKEKGYTPVGSRATTARPAELDANQAEYDALPTKGKDRLLYRHNNPAYEEYLVKEQGYSPVGDRWMEKKPASTPTPKPTSTPTPTATATAAARTTPTPTPTPTSTPTPTPTPKKGPPRINLDLEK